MQAEVFEEIATMEFPFEGIPTVPPRKDMDHMVGTLTFELHAHICTYNDNPRKRVGVLL